MQIYHYHPTTHEFLGAGLADPSPLEPGVWLIPAHATQVIPPMPQAGTVRKFIAGAWVLEPLTQDEAPVDPGYEPSVQDLAAAKLEAINSGKNVALDAGFVHDGVLYDSDYKARLAYLEAATQFQLDPEFSTQWKASTGQWVTMDAALFAALIPVYRAHVQGCFAWQGAREQEVAVALALEDEGEIRAALAAIPESM